MAIRVPTPVTQGAQNLGGAQAQAAATPYQRLTLPDTSFNSRMLQQIGQSGVQFANYLQEQEDERLLLEFQAGLGEFERGLLYGQDANGNPTGQGGILALEGPDAFGLTERVQRDLDQQLSQYNTSLRGLSRNGRAAAQRYAQSRREALLDQTARFEFQQREAYNAKLRQQAEAAAAAAAETAWATPEAMADAETRIISATTNRAAADAAMILDENERQQFIDNEVAAAVEEFHRTAILRAIGQGKTQIGRQLYDQAVERGTINLQENDLLTRTVQYGEQIDVVINGATMIFDQYPNDLAGAIDAARGMGLDGDTEQDLVAEIQRRFTTAEAISAQNVAQLTERARLLAVEGRLDEMSVVERAQISDAALARLDYINRGGAEVTVVETYNELAALDYRDLAIVDLTTVMDQLSANNYEYFQNLQAKALAAIAGDDQALIESMNYGTVQGAVSDGISSYSIDDPSQQGELRQHIGSWQAVFAIEQRRKPTYQEAAKEIDDWVAGRQIRPSPAAVAEEQRTLTESMNYGTVQGAVSDAISSYSIDDPAQQGELRQQISSWQEAFAIEQGRRPTYQETAREIDDWVAGRQIRPSPAAVAAGQRATAGAAGTFDDALGTITGGIEAKNATGRRKKSNAEQIVRAWAAEFGSANNRPPTYAETLDFWNSVPDEAREDPGRGGAGWGSPLGAYSAQEVGRALAIMSTNGVPTDEDSIVTVLDLLAYGYNASQIDSALVNQAAELLGD
jgi:hypothetical protein